VAVLKEEKVHPVTIMVSEGSLDSWPHGEAWLPMVLDAIALRLFGEEALDPGTGHLHTIYRSPLQAMVQRTWESLRKQFQRDRKKLDEYEKQAIDAYESQ
jgi:hypothetical protein